VPGLLRLGRWVDGGYIVPYSAVHTADALISFGISNDWSFEEGFHAINPRAPIHAYDHTVSAGMFRKQFLKGLWRWTLGKAPLADIGQRLWLWRDFRAFFGSHSRRHFEEKIVGKESRRGEATVDVAFARLDQSRTNVFLKVDIERSEYEIIDAIMRHAGRIEALAIEFHNTIHAREPFSRAMGELLRQFEIVHLHANNFGSIAPDGLPETLEITLVRRTGTSFAKRSELPIQLDRPNDPRRGDYSLRFVL
jgi:hypothetical protein